MTRCGLRRAAVFVAASALTTALTAGARAQGMYYQEVEKEGRVYVFNGAAAYEAWAKSGELGKGITRLDYGPDGETVVFDSEAAIHLYNFKHGKPGEALAEPKNPKMEVSWKDGKTTIATDKAELKISNRVQVRFTDEIPDGANQLPGTAAKGDSKASFRIRRAKTKFEGWFYNQQLSYELQLNWPDLGGSTPGNALEDAWINWDVSKDGSFQIKFGQYKVPFGRQELTSSGNQQFVDRSITSGEFAKGRDQGLQIWGLLADKRVEWRAGLFNGNGRTKTANDNDKFQYNARLQFAPNGDPKYSESDFDSKDRALWSIAAEFESNDFANVNSDPAKNVKRTIFGVDAVFKYKGLSAFAEYFDRKLDPQSGTSFKSSGYHAQIGYLLDKGRRWEIAARYASWDPTDRVSGNDRTEVGGAVNYFYNKHNLKVQADFRQLEDKAKNTKDKEFRLQTQFVF